MNKEIEKEKSKDIEKARNLPTRTQRRKETLKLREKYKDDSIVIYSKKHINNRKQPISKQQRRELLKNKELVAELFTIVKQYLPDLLICFENLTDIRNQSYVKYKMKSLLTIRLFALVCGITSMNEMERRFNTQQAIDNFSLFLEEQLLEMPNWQTIQDVIENLSYQEIEDIRTRIVKKLIRSKMFDKYRYNGYFQLLVDATGITSRNYNLNGNCLTRTTTSMKKVNGVKQAVKTTTYYKYVLEAKLVVGNIVVSLDTEWIENVESNNENDKQDCETKAFKRMAERISTNYPKTKFIITGDALYATEPMMDICKDNHWHYIFNLKPERLKKVADFFEGNIKIHNETSIANYYLSSGIPHGKHLLNVIKYQEVLEDGKLLIFRYVTDLNVTDNTIQEIVKRGRARWKIENEGFNMQKNGTFCISHLCSYNENALRIHYLFIQFAHLIRQLFELGSVVVRNACITSKKETSFQLTIELTSKKLTALSEHTVQLRFLDDFNVY